MLAQVQSGRQKNQCLVSSKTDREFICFHTPANSIETVNRLDKTHLYCRGQSALVSSTIHFFTSSRNILTDIPWNNMQPSIWGLVIPGKQIHKVNLSLGFRKCWSILTADADNNEIVQIAL